MSTGDPSKGRIGAGLSALLACAALLAGPARAGDAYDDRYFVKIGATGHDLLADRAECRRQALTLGSSAAAYSDPQYGALSALGAAIDSDALHGDGLRRRMRDAVLESCMKRQGWTPLQPDAEDARALARASGRRPEVLDAWLTAHQPPPAPPPAPEASVATAAKPAAPEGPPPVVFTSGPYARATPYPSASAAPGAPAPSAPAVAAPKSGGK